MLFTSSQLQYFSLLSPTDLWYSSRGGSTRMTSNLQLRSRMSYVSKSHLRYIGGVAVCWISSSFKRINSRSLGYSSNRFSRPVQKQPKKHADHSRKHSMHRMPQNWYCTPQVSEGSKPPTNVNFLGSFTIMKAIAGFLLITTDDLLRPMKHHQKFPNLVKVLRTLSQIMALDDRIGQVKDRHPSPQREKTVPCFTERRQTPSWLARCQPSFLASVAVSSRDFFAC